jgi:aryl-alcohol dehydrogenase-like predicted oxidoreductase/predicted kinase
MRLPGDGLDTITAAVGAGVTVFDTARAYGATSKSPRLDSGGEGSAGEGDNERLLARALRAAGGAHSARIVTKGGMARFGTAWVPDGRARAIAADCQASLAALDGLPIDLYLLHAPDPRTPWRTSVRALARLAQEGLVARIGVANVNRTQLDEALELAPVAAVQVALSPFDDHALRGGVVTRCAERGLTLIAHSPLGGPRRARALTRHRQLTHIAARHGASPAEAALAWVIGLSPQVVAIPGARSPASARSAARAALLALDDDERETLAVAFGAATPAGGGPRVGASADARGAGAALDRLPRGDVVVVMGIPGAGKSRVAAGYVERGYARLNRDERGGSLRALTDDLDEQLTGGAQRVVLDNTYLTRAARNRVIEVAGRHSLAVRCLWLQTPLAQAQVNLVERLLDRFDALPTPDQIKAAARQEPWLMLPTSQMRALRELEPPSMDEGFAAVERLQFVRSARSGQQPGVFVGAAAAARAGLEAALHLADPSAPHLLFDWMPEGDTSHLAVSAGRIADLVSGRVEVAVCPHPGGPPTCWCRPPLPGLPLAFARAHRVDLTRSALVGCSPTHRTLAATLGVRYLNAEEQPR